MSPTARTARPSSLTGSSWPRTGAVNRLCGSGMEAIGQAACRVANEAGQRPGVDYVGEYRVDWTNALEDGLENPIIHSAFGYAAQLVIADRATGKIEKVVAVHDVGKAINPMLVEGQIEGAVHMGLGYALTEEFPTDDRGMPTNMTLRSLGILRAKDIPEIEAILVEAPQPRAPYGVKGVGEIGLVPTAGAVAAAFHEIDGTWRTRLPERTPPIESARGRWRLVTGARSSRSPRSSRRRPSPRARGP